MCISPEVCGLQHSVCTVANQTPVGSPGGGNVKNSMHTTACPPQQLVFSAFQSENISVTRVLFSVILFPFLNGPCWQRLPNLVAVSSTVTTIYCMKTITPLLCPHQLYWVAQGSCMRRVGNRSFSLLTFTTLCITSYASTVKDKGSPAHVC